MAEFGLKFKVNGCGFGCHGKDGKPFLNVGYECSSLVIEAYYPTHDAPLRLTAPVNQGDEVLFAVRLHRIELWVNNILMDEEWPDSPPLFGDGYVENGRLCPEKDEKIIFYSVCDLEEPAEEPSFCGSFIDAEGWFPRNGVFVGDCMPYTHDGRYHVLYLKDRHHHKSKWGMGAHQWAHISTTDFLHWDIHPMAVEIDEPWEGSICTGSHIYDNGIHWLYYTVRMADGSSAPICRSRSEDGYHFRKDKSFRFTLSDAYHGGSARDPKVVRGEDGLLHMFVTTSHLASGKGCLAHLTSADGEQWTEEGMIYTAPDGNQPECPDYFVMKGSGGKIWYYLVFSHYGKGQYLVSDQPFTGWRKPKEDHIPCSSVPKAAVWKNRLLFTGFSGLGGYAGYMTFLEAFPGEDGELTYWKPDLR